MINFYKSRISLILIQYLWIITTIISFGIMGCSDGENDRGFCNKGDLCLVEVDGVFQDVEMDEYPEYLNGGNEGFIEDLFTVLKYPAEARENGIEGTCILHYEITEEGTVENIQVIEDPGAGIGDASTESLFSITEGIAFKPGVINRVSVRVKKDLNIDFKLEG